MKIHVFDKLLHWLLPSKSISMIWNQILYLLKFRFIDQSSFLPCQWPIHSLYKWVNSSCQWIYQVHHVLQPSNTSIFVSIDEARYETVSCLSTLIFDRLAQASTRIQIVCDGVFFFNWNSIPLFYFVSGRMFRRNFCIRKCSITINNSSIFS